MKRTNKWTISFCIECYNINDKIYYFFFYGLLWKRAFVVSVFGKPHGIPLNLRSAEPILWLCSKKCVNRGLIIDQFTLISKLTAQNHNKSNLKLKKYRCAETKQTNVECLAFRLGQLSRPRARKYLNIENNLKYTQR